MILLWPIQILANLQNPNLTTIQDNGQKNVFTVGLGTSWFNRKDYGASTFNRFYPEIVVYSYSQLINDLYLRWGLRLAYSQDDPEFPKGLQIKEKDYMILTHTSVVLDGIVLPTIGLITGLQYKIIKVIHSSMIDTRLSTIDNNEWIPILGLQFGLGVPLNQGLVVIEPYIRSTVQPKFKKLLSDTRGWFWFGLDVTLEL